MKSSAGVVYVNDLKIVIKYEKVLRGVNSMSNESPLDQGMSNRVSAIGMMTMLLTEILDVWGPSIRIFDKRVGRFGGRNVCQIAIDF